MKSKYITVSISITKTSELVPKLITKLKNPQPKKINNIFNDYLFYSLFTAEGYN